nr:hypothetical protein Iba_chr03aCG19330 [Ipomoea batatas]GMC76193.1 hypothetical protein Iba_chr03dCG12010 [Ipomoea batatas]
MRSCTEVGGEEGRAPGKQNQSNAELENEDDDAILSMHLPGYKSMQVIGTLAMVNARKGFHVSTVWHYFLRQRLKHRIFFEKFYYLLPFST